MKKYISFVIFIAFCTICSAHDIIGTTEGAFSVSQIGGATYNIPIQVRDGYSNFTPQLSLSYDSTRGNGIAGFGWEISGLSAISIAQRNKYFDGYNIQGPSISTNDVYSIDGMRLLLKSGLPGRKNAEYVTEEDQFCRIYIDSAFSGTPKSFVVKHPDGTTYRYGSSQTAIARYPNQTSNAAYYWLLDYAEDKNGNYINYTYTYYNDLPYISSIDYGGNKLSGCSSYCSIKFGYVNRTDTIITNIKEKSFLKTRKLSTIVCFYNGNVYRRYLLSYDNVSYFSHLISVKEYGTNNESYPATTFVWNNLPTLNFTSSNVYVTSEINPYNNYYYFSGDIDNDGTSELIGLCPRVSEYSILNVYKKSSNNFVRSSSFMANICYDWNNQWKNEGRTFHGGFVARLSKNKNNAIVIAKLIKEIGESNKVRFECYGNQGEHYCDKTYEIDTNEMPVYTVADYDNDGIETITYIEKRQSANTIKISHLDINLEHPTLSTCTNQLLTLSSQYYNAIKGCNTADYDNDGLTDIMIICDNCCVILWNINGTFSASNYTVYSNIKHGDTFQLADFNGDGRVDIIINEPSSYTWKKAINTGCRNSLFSVSNISNLSNLQIKRQSSNDSLYYCIVQDFDLDGLSDILISYKANNKQNFRLVKAERDNTFSLYPLGNSSLNSVVKNYHIVNGDFDGDGYSEIVGYGGDITVNNNTSKVWKLYKGTEFSPGCNKIAQITDGFGKTVSVEYASLLNDYSNQEVVSYPLLQFNAALPVVVTSSNTWNGITKLTTYQYKDGIAHLNGKGFLGFGHFSSTSNEIVHNVSFGLNTTYFSRYIETSKSTDLYGNIITNQTFSYCYNSTPVQKQFRKWLYMSESGDVAKNISERTCYSDYHNGMASSLRIDCVTSKNTEIEYQDSISNGVWIQNMPLSITTEYDANDPDVIFNKFYEKDNYMYDAQGNVVVKEGYKSNTLSSWSLENKELLMYNEGGKIIADTNIPYNSTESLTSLYEYDSLGRLTREVKPDGHSVAYSYNFLGLLDSETDEWFSIRKQYTYDGFGKEISCIKTSLDGVFSPETTTTTIELTSDLNCLYKITTSHTNEPTHVSYYDGFGRELASGSVHFDGMEYLIEKQYSNADVVSFISELHQKGETSDIGTSYTYDSRLRPVTITSPTDITEIIYNENIKTITTNGLCTAFEYRNDGKVISKVDSSGDIYYYYNAIGDYDHLLLSYANDDMPDIEIPYTYDKYGRLSRYTDSDGTTRGFTYNNKGQLQIYKNGDKLTYYYYNKYGDITRKLYSPKSSLTTARYYYDNKRQLTSISCTGVNESNTYNSAGMLVSKTRTISDLGSTHSRTSTYTYNGTKLNSITSVLDGVAQPLTESYSYDRGWLTGIYFNGKKVWHLDNEDAKGRMSLLSDWLSNTQYTYDNGNRVLSYSTSFFPSNNINSITRTYAYNGNGLISEKDGYYYDYDDMNQLTGWNDKSYSYDSRGNIEMVGAQYGIRYNGYKLQSVTLPQADVWNNNNIQIDYNGNNQPYNIYMDVVDQDYAIELTLNYDYAFNKISSIQRTIHNPQSNGNSNVTGTSEPIGFVRYYVDKQYEINNSTRYLYIGGDPLTACAVAEIRNDSIKLYQIYRDELGSIIALSDSVNLSRYYYDPWGRYCDENGDMSNAIYANGGNMGNPFYRGFLGQEYYTSFGLINLNARLYNPFIGRFLSPDPVFDESRSLKNFNPYIYGNNCPNMYADPNGDFAITSALFVSMILGGAINTFANFDRIENGWQFLGYFATGAVSGAGSYFTGGLANGILSGMGIGLVSGSAISAVSNGFNNLIAGDNFTTNIGTSALIGGAGGLVIGGFFGGIYASKNNLNLWTGRTKYIQMPSKYTSGLRSEIENSSYISPEMKIQDLCCEEFLCTPQRIQSNLPENYRSMTSYQKGELGVKMQIRNLGLQTGNYAREISLDVNGTVYRADFVYYDENKLLHIVEVKTGPYARPTPNQKIVFPLLQKGENVTIRPFGGNAQLFWHENIPSAIENYSFDYYHIH